MDFSKESIFSSSLRALCHAFFVVIGIFIAMIPVGLFFFGASIATHKETFEKNQLEILPDVHGHRSISDMRAPVVLEIAIDGVIGKNNLKTGILHSQLLESREGILKDGRVKAILLRVNTPGGTVKDSDGMYRLLMEYKEHFKVPVYAYIDGLCASGGMYITSAADKTYSSPVSIIGSVGVIIGPFFNAVHALDKLGLKAMTITQGKDKDMLSPFRSWKEGEDDSLKAISAFFYEQFVDIVTKARPRLNKQKLIHNYGAQVYDAETAQDYGYIDHANSSYVTCLKDLLKEADINEHDPYQVVMLEPRKQWLSELFQAESSLLSGKIKHVVQVGPFDTETFTEPFSYLYLPGVNHQ